MKRIISTTCSRWQRLLLLMVMFFAPLLASGCAGGNYGHFDRDRRLDNMFLNYEVLADHRYYTTGGYDAPNAILAVHRNYELDNPRDLWVGIANVDSTQMRKWIDAIAPEQNYRYSNGYFAAYIVDPAGKRIGAWYSYATTTTIKFLDGNKIQVYTPDLNQNIYLHKGLRMRGGF